MSKQTFDPITRNIRAVEAEARVVISATETAIQSARRKRNPTVAAFKPVFDKIDACLNNTNQLYDVVVANAHEVADNIATRSRRNVLAVRQSLLETAARMIELCNITPLPEGVYDPSGAYNRIDALLAQGGFLTAPTRLDGATLSSNSVVSIATYTLEDGFQFSVVVLVAASSEGKNLGEGSDEITVSVWEDRDPPPTWDISYHNAAGVPVQVGVKQGKRIGQWTLQTDNAIIDYVANVLSKDVKFPKNIPASGGSFQQHEVPDSPADRPSRYGTFIPRQGKQGSAKFDYVQRADILRMAIQGTTLGPQGELVVNLDPATINKITLARYIQSVIQSYANVPLGGSVKLASEGYYQILFPSATMQGFDISAALEGKF